VCFDFVDTNGHPINTPGGWDVYSVARLLWHPEPSVEVHGGMKRKDIIPGAEKYNVVHGGRIAIRIPNRGTIGIKIPRYGQDGRRIDVEDSVHWDVKEVY
jgi:hypothetical protein